MSRLWRWLLKDAPCEEVPLRVWVSVTASLLTASYVGFFWMVLLIGWKTPGYNDYVALGTHFAHGELGLPFLVLGGAVFWSMLITKRWKRPVMLNAAALILIMSCIVFAEVPCKLVNQRVVYTRFKLDDLSK